MNMELLAKLRHKKETDKQLMIPDNCVIPTHTVINTEPGKVQTRYKEIFFLIKVLEHWNSLPSEMTNVPWLCSRGI